MTLSAPVATSPDGPWRAREVDAAPVGDGSPLRQTSIDVLRSIAICLMIVVHFVENLSAGHDAASTALAATLPAGVAAPLFLFLVGVNYRLWADMQADRGRSSTSVSKRSVRRGLFLVGAGFAFNVLVWLPEDTFNWDVLTFVGIALLVLDVARRMPPSVVVCGAGIILAISPVLRGVADYAAYWQQPWFDYDFTLSDVALGGLVVGYFPLFPWLVLPLTGFLVAPLIFGSRGRPSRCFGIAGGLAAVSAGVLAVWPLLPDRWRAGAADGWSMFPASTAYILGSSALALAGTTRRLDGPLQPPFLLDLRAAPHRARLAALDRRPHRRCRRDVLADRPAGLRGPRPGRGLHRRLRPALRLGRPAPTAVTRVAHALGVRLRAPPRSEFLSGMPPAATSAALRGG
jgi:uncharacterized membrane protein